MEYEYDPSKSLTNLAKHGIDFEAAKAIWDDPDHLEIPARTSDEPRFMVIGRIADRFWAAVIARRQGRIRIISVRRARTEEIAVYESI